jgi:hypothetical protein
MFKDLPAAFEGAFDCAVLGIATISAAASKAPPLSIRVPSRVLTVASIRVSQQLIFTATAYRKYTYRANNLITYLLRG